MSLARNAILISMLASLGNLAFARAAAPGQPEANAQPSSQEGDVSIEVRGWSKIPRWRGKGPIPRHHLVTSWGIPAPYRNMTNPLPRTHATLRLGKAIYTTHCAPCHGTTGAGDGPQAKGLVPSPGNLVWLSDIPETQWDPYIFWTTAEGGAPLGTAMPAFRDLLSSEDIWAVSAYIQANLPFVSQWRLR